MRPGHPARRARAVRSGPPRGVAVSATPVRDDLAEWWSASAPSPASPVFAAASGGFWRASDWRNWRKRIYKPVAEHVGIDGACPYHLRHAFASLLIHEGRLSVVEIAAQLGHNPTVCLDTYAHVMAEQEEGERTSAEEQIIPSQAGPAVDCRRTGPSAGLRRPRRLTRMDPVDLATFSVIAELHSGIDASRLARMDRVVQLASSALAAPLAGYGEVELSPRSPTRRRSTHRGSCGTIRCPAW